MTTNSIQDDRTFYCETDIAELAGKFLEANPNISPEHGPIASALIVLSDAAEFKECHLNGYEPDGDTTRPAKTFDVWVNLYAEIEAPDDDEAFDSMMELIEDRGGMEITEHTILERESE